MLAPRTGCAGCVRKMASGIRNRGLSDCEEAAEGPSGDVCASLRMAAAAGLALVGRLPSGPPPPLFGGKEV